LERPNPGEQRIVRGFYRGRLTDSQREQGPEAGTIATYRDLIVGLHIRKRHVGKWTVINRSVEARHGSRPERDSESGPGEREKLRRVNPRSGSIEQSMPGRERQSVKDVETSKTAGSGRDARTRYSRPIRCRGTKPHGSGGNSQGLPRSFGSYSAGEPKLRRVGSRHYLEPSLKWKTSKWQAALAQQNRREGSLKSYGDTFSEQLCRAGELHERRMRWR